MIVAYHNTSFSYPCDRLLSANINNKYRLLFFGYVSINTDSVKRCNKFDNISDWKQIPDTFDVQWTVRLCHSNSFSVDIICQIVGLEMR